MTLTSSTILRWGNLVRGLNTSDVILPCVLVLEEEFTLKYRGFGQNELATTYPRGTKVTVLSLEVMRKDSERSIPLATFPPAGDDGLIPTVTSTGGFFWSREGGAKVRA